MISLRRLLTSSFSLLLALQYSVFAPHAYSVSFHTPTIDTLTTPQPTTIVTPTSLPIRVRAGSIVVTEGQTSVQIPLDLLDVATDRPLGALSLSLQYDVTRLKAVTCTVNATFDLLLCNLAKSGVIQLAGVDGSGIRTNTRIADLTFEILQPAKLSVPLTVQLKRVANRDGDTMSAAAENGAVDLSCAAVGSNCPKIYLPVISK